MGKNHCSVQNCHYVINPFLTFHKILAVKVEQGFCNTAMFGKCKVVRSMESEFYVELFYINPILHFSSRFYKYI